MIGSLSAHAEKPLKELGIILLEGNYEQTPQTQELSLSGLSPTHVALGPTAHTIKLKFLVNEATFLKARCTASPNSFIRRLHSLILNPSDAMNDKNPIHSVVGTKREQWYLNSVNINVSTSKPNTREVELELRSYVPSSNTNSATHFTKPVAIEKPKVNKFKIRQIFRKRKAEWALDIPELYSKNND